MVCRQAALAAVCAQQECIKTTPTTVTPRAHAHRGSQAAERRHVHVELIRKARGERERVLAALRRPLDDLVVNVCEVAHVLHVVPQRRQQAIQHVKRDVYARMAWGTAGRGGARGQGGRRQEGVGW
jgi:hypothetical protein